METVGKLFLMFSGVVIVVVAIIHFSSSADNSRASLIIPAEESRFISIVSGAQANARSTANDMQKGGVKAKRDTAICETLSSAEVSGWVGTIKTIDSNSDGYGVLTVEIAPGVMVKTWNNALSDILTGTLLKPGSPVFEKASAMKTGQAVSFSGQFFSDIGGACLMESSLTLDGKVKNPEFIFRFGDINDYAPRGLSSAGTESARPQVKRATTLTPHELIGSWTVTRLRINDSPACDEALVTAVVGSTINYSSRGFTWNNMDAVNTAVRTGPLDIQQLESDYKMGSGEISVLDGATKEVTIDHPSQVMPDSPTIQIPGDTVFIKPSGSIILEVGGMWFEAERAS